RPARCGCSAPPGRPACRRTGRRCPPDAPPRSACTRPGGPTERPEAGPPSAVVHPSVQPHRSRPPPADALAAPAPPAPSVVPAPARTGGRPAALRGHGSGRRARRSLPLGLRGQLRDQRVVGLVLADLGGAAGRADLIEELDVGLVVLGPL